MEIRPVRRDEHERLGALTVDAYRAVPGGSLSDAYADLLRAIERRAREALVLVAVDGDELLGGVTYVDDASNEWAEHLCEGEAGIRMLAVAPAAWGRGVGAALTEACLSQATRDGRTAVVLSSTSAMTRAHALYERLGFRRAPERDWSPFAGLDLRSYVYDLGA